MFIKHTFILYSKAVPLSRQGNIVDLIMGRLRDKSANVRKYSVQFLKVALVGNPYGAKVIFISCVLHLKVLYIC